MAVGRVIESVETVEIRSLSYPCCCPSGDEVLRGRERDFLDEYRDEARDSFSSSVDLRRALGPRS